MIAGLEEEGAHIFASVNEAISLSLGRGGGGWGWGWGEWGRERGCVSGCGVLGERSSN